MGRSQARAGRPAARKAAVVRRKAELVRFTFRPKRLAITVY